MLAYIHIPFCDSKCHYCSFNSYVHLHPLKSAYMEALLVQTKALCQKLPQGAIETLFIGGGTPSCVGVDLYEPLFEYLAPLLSNNSEITIEANPNSATKGWLKGIRELGANRISFGAQSFDSNKLKTLGRSHNTNDIIRAVNEAHDVGFAHINLDLIYNLQGDTKKLLKSDIEQAFLLPIDHLCAYELTIEANTPFASMPSIAQKECELDFYIQELICSKGFEHYEVSNYGSYQSRHNKGYWAHKPYLGIGAGAVGFDGECRYYPQSDVARYIQSPMQKRVEKLTSQELKSEKIFLGLRSNLGFERSLLSANELQKLQILLREKRLSLKGDRVINSELFLADEMALFLLD